MKVFSHELLTIAGVHVVILCLPCNRNGIRQFAIARHDLGALGIDTDSLKFNKHHYFIFTRSAGSVEATLIEMQGGN